jgi:hypothetical protein
MFLPKDSSDKATKLTDTYPANQKQLWETPVFYRRKSNRSRKESQKFIPLIKEYGSQHSKISIFLGTTGVSEELLAELLAEETLYEQALYILSNNILDLKSYAENLLSLDYHTKDVIHPLVNHCSEIVLEQLDDAGISPEFDAHRISLNLNTVVELAKYALKQRKLPPTQWLGDALSIFLFHEISHHSQGLTHHRDVQAMKSVNLQNANHRMAEFDLRSDYIAAHTLSCLKTIQKNSTYNEEIYYKYLYQTWCVVGRGMLEAFPVKNGRKIKIGTLRRIFGYLLMANLISDAHNTCDLPFKLKGELFPEWKTSCDKLSIWSNGKVYIKGQPVDSRIMKRVVKALLRRDYDGAAKDIRQIWQSLPR